MKFFQRTLRSQYRKQWKLSCSHRYSHSALSHQIQFQNLLGNKNAVKSEDIESFISDWTKHYHGGSLVCFPSSSEDVSRVFQYCHQNEIEMVPQGGNTGLVCCID
jgi:hypothetical protein